jgi:phosphatidylglycerol---prolipoprotein diacylglyceryl transferase
MIDPIAFQIGTLEIRWYGIMMAIGLLGGFLIWKKIAKDHGLDKENVVKAYLFFLLGLFIGARIFHILIYDFNFFFNNPLQIILIWQGGLSSHGAIIGGSLAGYYYLKKNKFNVWRLADRVVIAVSFAAGCVRIGNFLNSEIVGRIVDVPWAVKFYGYDDYRHPSQLYESAKNFFISGFLYTLNSIKSLNLPDGFLYWLFIFLFSLLRFFTEFFKEYLILTNGLTIGQWISIFFMIVSGTCLILTTRKKSS